MWRIWISDRTRQGWIAALAGFGSCAFSIWVAIHLNHAVGSPQTDWGCGRGDAVFLRQVNGLLEITCGIAIVGLVSQLNAMAYVLARNFHILTAVALIVIFIGFIWLHLSYRGYISACDPYEMPRILAALANGLAAITVGISSVLIHRFAVKLAIKR